MFIAIGAHQPYRRLMDEILDIAIIGAGIAGIGAAVRLTRDCPDKSIAVIERRARVGGTWDLFRYPGVRCDSDMFTLGFDFKPWKHEKSIVGASTIRDYIEEAAQENAILPLIQFGTRLTHANWDSDAGYWTLTLADEGTGVERSQRARILYMAAGYYDYDEGYRATLPQEEAFAGRIVHPQHWPQDLDYSDKRVTVIGSGATAMTLLPAMAATAAKVTMIQRSPTYVLSRPSNDRITRWTRAVLPEKLAYHIVRFRNRTLLRLLFRASRKHPEKIRKMLLKEVKQAIGANVDVGKHFTPRYGPWQERMCLIPDGDLYDAINSGKADVVTDEITGFTAEGPVLKQTGEVLPTDVLVVATGLKLAMLGKAELSVDAIPVNVAERMIYKGCMLSEVPNMLFVFGYYASASWTLKSDLVAHYAARLVQTMDTAKVERFAPIAPAPDVTRLPMFDFQSGYIQRAAAILPGQGSAGPWTLPQDYPFDRKRLAKEAVADGVLRFA